MSEEKKIGRSLLFYQLKKSLMLCCFPYVTAYLSRGLCTFVDTAVSKHVAIKVYKKVVRDCNVLVILCLLYKER